MPVLKSHLSSLWGIWKIDETWEELLQLSGRPDEYLTKLESFTSDKRKCEWLAVRLLLKHLLGEYATIAYRDSGVPYLPDLPYRISISHTNGYAAVLLDASGPAGIDIEYRSDRIARIKSRFMNERELQLFGDMDVEGLLVCWSAKETAFKMMECRVADLQYDLHIVSFNYTGSDGNVTVKETLTSSQKVYPIVYQITPDFILTRSK